MIAEERIKSVLFGVAVGDALGVPVEFRSRKHLVAYPVNDMIGFGTHNMPVGTFSDDTSMMMCLAEALTTGFNLNEIAQNFVKWRDEGYWTATGEVFDIGNATNQAISRIKAGVKSEEAGGRGEGSNGNGSLMRILPLVFYLYDKSISERYSVTKQVSSITHGHIRSVIACFYYLEFARELLSSKDKFSVYKELQRAVPEYLKNQQIDQNEIDLFDRLLKNNIYELPEDKIRSTGYVIDTLEASIWCLLTTENYKDALLKAVNLGDDSDTTGAVTGGLAGLLYGYQRIPKGWIRKLARSKDIGEVAKRLFLNKINKSSFK